MASRCFLRCKGIGVPFHLLVYQNSTRSHRLTISPNPAVAAIASQSKSYTQKLFHSTTPRHYQHTMTTSSSGSKNCINSGRVVNAFKDSVSGVKVEHTLQEAVLDVHESKYLARYVDDGDVNDPVMLCLHGVPANYKDFLPIMPLLVNSGVRVIIPNFPGATHTSHLGGAPFDYTHLSKAKFVEALLSHLNIDRVDMMVSHSAACHTGMHLCAHTDLIDAVTFISPMSHLKPSVAYKTFLSNVLYFGLKLPIMRALFGPLLQPIMNKILPLDTGNIDWLYRLVAESKQFNYKQAEADLKTINATNKPVMVLTALRDRIIDTHTQYGAMDVLEIAQEGRWSFTKDHTLVENGIGNNPWKKAILFEKSSHWIQKSHPEVVTGLVLDFMKTTQDLGVNDSSIRCSVNHK